jgi:succinoglycan biosynthesis transport protein ExoP
VSHFGAHLARIWRRRYLVLVIAALSALAAFATVQGAGATYTATSTLITVSPNRAPEQDGILARGYVDLFGSPSLQRGLRQRAEVPPNVTLTAQTAAASPIIYISATSTDAESAKATAGRVAEEFRLEVNASLKTGVDRAIAAMRKPIDDAVKSSGAVPQVTLIQLQDRINGLNADTSNRLEVLQSDIGGTVSQPPTTRLVGVGLVGGLIFGCAVAWALGFCSRRLITPYDLEEKAAIEPLVVMPQLGDTTEELHRDAQLGQVAVAIALAGLQGPSVVAIAPVQATPVSGDIASAVARYRADQRIRTVLVHADPSSSTGSLKQAGRPLVDGLFQLTGEADDQLREVMLTGPDEDARLLLSPERMRALVAELRTIADLIVISAPPTVWAESSLVCATADLTLLVVESGMSVTDVVSARSLLAKSDVAILGVVFVASSGRRRRPRMPRRATMSPRVPRTTGRTMEHSAGREADAMASVPVAPSALATGAANVTPKDVGKLDTLRGSQPAEQTKAERVGPGTVVEDAVADVVKPTKPPEEPITAKEDSDSELAEVVAPTPSSRPIEPNSGEQAVPHEKTAAQDLADRLRADENGLEWVHIPSSRR